MAAQTAFRQDFVEEQPCVAALDAQMRHCALTMAMIDSRLFAEAGAIMCRIAMISHAHMLSFCKVRLLPTRFLLAAGPCCPVSSSATVLRCTFLGGPLPLVGVPDTLLWCSVMQLFMSS